jgi:hypothetical protein
MFLRKTHAKRRHGMTVVESALIMVVLAMLLFGIFEYCRFLLVLHMTNNAARDGARYAAVNLDKPGNFDVVDYTSPTGRVYANIHRYTKERMGSCDGQLIDCKVAVYPVDFAGLQLTPPVVRPKTLDPGGTDFPDPFDPGDASLMTEWNALVFTERMAVTIQGTYKTALPNLLWMPSTIKINVTALSYSEGG